MKQVTRVLITGGSGFIGSHFLLHSKNQKRYKVFAPAHKEMDLMDTSSIARTFRAVRPDVVINFAAHRNANTAEMQSGDRTGSAWMTNVVGVTNIAKLVKTFSSFLIHISTDMVFSGSETHKGPYAEDEAPETSAPHLTWYGFTKAEGERVLLGRIRSAIVRIGNVTQPVYDPTLDYVGKILFLYDHHKLYPLFTNQYLTLTATRTLFAILDVLIKKRAPGVFHATSKDVFTPYELGVYLLKKFRNKNRVVSKVDIDAYLASSPNRYPKYGGLLGSKTTKALNTPLYSWRQIADMFAEVDKKLS